MVYVYTVYFLFVTVSILKSELTMFDLDRQGYRIFVLNRPNGILDVTSFALKIFWNMLAISLIITFPISALMLIAAYLDTLS